MISAGYLAKRNIAAPNAFRTLLPNIADVLSVSNCVNDNFADYIPYWEHNGFWLFDSPEAIRELCRRESINLDGVLLFYYEVFEQEFDEGRWREFVPESSLRTRVLLPEKKHLEGFDVVTFFAGNAPECSPLSCNGIAEELPTNEHCLLESLEMARHALDEKAFDSGEPGPHRIFAVYSVTWP